MRRYQIKFRNGGIRNLKDRLKTYGFVERNKGFSANQIK